MNDQNIDYTGIALILRDLGEKKVLKKSLDYIDLDKKVYIYYSKRRNVPTCTLPFFRLILSSRIGFLTFCYSFYNFMYNNYSPLEVNHENMQCIASSVVSHELGHILDPKIGSNRVDHATLINTLIDQLLDYDINVKDENLHKTNLPYDIEECALSIKRNLIDRECNAWVIAEDILHFQNEHHKFIFDRIKEYALATYNFGNINTIIRDNHLDTYLGYIKTFSRTQNRG